MAGSSYGTIFRITTWGESHGSGIGVTVDGCPAGLPLDEADVQKYLDRRRPGQSSYGTKRAESDRVRICSGVFSGKTTGSPIAMMVENTDARSADYKELADIYRPGHADYPMQIKYGIRDWRGGGRSSGRETIGRVAAGAVAAKMLHQMGISLFAYSESIGQICVDPSRFDRLVRDQNDLYMPDEEAAVQAKRYLTGCMQQQDSAGGVIACIVEGLPVGLGDPVFEKLDANLAKAMLSVGAVKGFEMGDGFAASHAMGRENNDAFGLDEEGKIVKKTNHSGGTLGGMSDGAPLFFRVAVKPTPSIARPQGSVNAKGEEVSLTIRGRHDPVIVPRAVVVVESMAAVTIADALLCNMSSRMDRVEDFYAKD